MEPNEHPSHRWTRFTDPDTKITTHWCTDGDTGHHEEPCADARTRTGEHVNDSDEEFEDRPITASA